MAARTFKIPAQVRDLIRKLPPDLKRKVREALDDILDDPGCGKPLKRELEGYWSLKVGRHRIIYRPDGEGVEIVALGPRRTIYEYAARILVRSRKKP